MKTIAALGLALILAGCSNGGWTNRGYLYRYVIWGGIPHQISPSDDYKLFPAHQIANGPTAFKFAPGPADTIPATVEYRDGSSLKQADLDALLKATDTHAFIVIKDDQIRYEKYFHGYQRDSICISRSVAKSFTSALVGIAIGEGYIKSVNDPITDYLPELKSQGFDQVTIRNLLMMSSGIRYRLTDLPWDEEPIAFFHPELREVLLQKLEITETPGESFHYDDYNTLLLGLVLERTTHRTPSQYLQEKIWQPIGMEYPATWSIDSTRDDFELMHAGINARAIDYAKLGRLFLNGGNWNGRQVVPASWVIESTTRDPNDRRKWETYRPWLSVDGYYKYFWWGVTKADDSYYYAAFGMWGQFIFVMPEQHMVIVRTAGNWALNGAQWAQVAAYIADHTR